MPFAFGDIYYVEFEPSVGHEYRGRRPGMVVQEESISKISSLVTVVPITSKLEHLKEPNVFIQKDEKNRLTLDSVIKVQHVSSFDRQRFIHFIGKANSPIIRQVRGYLRRHFGM